MKQNKQKKIRITWNGELLREVYPYATRWEVIKWRVARFMRRALILTAGAAFLSFTAYVSFAVGQVVNKPSVLSITAPEVAAPVLARIAKCESGGNHYDGSGQVLMHWNKNGTVDVGKYAINSVWFKTATKLGFDLTNPDDNFAMAQWIYANKGTGDWSASSKCWMK